MKQNKYDDLGFFEKYSQKRRSIGGLNAAGDWPAFRALLASVQDGRSGGGIVSVVTGLLHLDESTNKMVRVFK